MDHFQRVTKLALTESPRFDPKPLSRLQSGLGPQLAADLLQRTREDLAFLLASAAEAHRSRDFGSLSRTARRVEVLALQVGLPELRVSAANMASCAELTDAAALAATVARLGRLGRDALSGIRSMRVSGSC